METDPQRRHRRARHGHRHHRKERVLHTRISEQLAEDIREIADELRVPVSNLVRNVLEEAFSVVERVSDNVGDLVEDVVVEAERAADGFRRRRRAEGAVRTDGWSGRDAGADGRAADREPEAERPVEASRPSAPPRAEFSDVVGWQALILNQARSCVECGAHLERGAQAFAGMSTSGLSGAYLCGACIDARR